MLTAGIMFHDILSALLSSLRRKVRTFVLRPAMLRRQMLMWSASPPTSSSFGFPSLAKASSTSFVVGNWQKVSQGNLGVHQGPGDTRAQEEDRRKPVAHHFIDIGNRSVYMEIPPSPPPHPPPPSLIASYTHVHMLRCSPELKYHARKDAPTTMATAGK